MKSVKAISVVYDDYTVDTSDIKILKALEGDVLIIQGDASCVAGVAVQLQRIGCTIPVILMGPGISLQNISLVHENEMDNMGWCRKDYVKDLISRLKIELRRCVDLLDRECVYSDGHNADTTKAHLLLGDFEKEGDECQKT